VQPPSPASELASAGRILHGRSAGAFHSGASEIFSPSKCSERFRTFAFFSEPPASLDPINPDVHLMDGLTRRLSTAMATEPSTTSNDRKANDFEIDVRSRIKIYDFN